MNEHNDAIAKLNGLRRSDAGTVPTSPGATSDYHNRGMRYVYVKNGDAVAQLRRISGAAELDRSGPDAFIGEFLEAHGKDDVLVLSRARHAGYFRWKTVVARGIPSGRVVRRFLSAMRIGIEILRWRPQRILCGCTGDLLWICAAAAKWLNVPLVHARHNEVQWRKGAGRIVSALDRTSMRQCTGVVCHGPFLATQLRALDIVQDRIQEFEVDLEDFREAAVHAATHLAVRDFVRSLDALLVFVGRVQHNKGVFDLLEAFNCLRNETDRKIGLIYVGDGKDFATLRVRVGELRCEDTVLLLGRVTHGELPGIMRHATVIVAPTRPEFPEGRCMVVLESLVLGVPVLAPNCGPFPFAIDDEANGLLFVPGDVDDLKRCLLRVITEPHTQDRLRKGAVESARQIIAAHKSFATAVDVAFGPPIRQC